MCHSACAAIPGRGAPPPGCSRLQPRTAQAHTVDTSSLTPYDIQSLLAGSSSRTVCLQFPLLRQSFPLNYFLFFLLLAAHARTWPRVAANACSACATTRGGGSARVRDRGQRGHTLLTPPHLRPMARSRCLLAAHLRPLIYDLCHAVIACLLAAHARTWPRVAANACSACATTRGEGAPASATEGNAGAALSELERARGARGSGGGWGARCRPGVWPRAVGAEGVVSNPLALLPVLLRAPPAPLHPPPLLGCVAVWPTHEMQASCAPASASSSPPSPLVCMWRGVCARVRV